MFSRRSQFIVAVCIFIVGLGAGFMGNRLGVVGYVRSLLTIQPALVAMPDGSHYPHRTSFFRSFPKESAVVMVGDSITEMADWGSVFPGVDLANRGISLDNTVGLLARIDTVLGTHAATAFLMIGTNDLDVTADIDGVFERYKEIVAKLSEQMDVVAQSVVFTSDPKKNQRIAALNARVENLCRSSGCSFVDLNRMLAPNGTLLADFTEDGLHLNGPGYAAWAEVIRPFVVATAN